MRRVASSGEAPGAEEEGMTDGLGETSDEEEGDTTPQRKSTLSKDLSAKDVMTVTYASFMARANLLGFMLLACPIIGVLAFATGNLHPASGILAAVSGVLSLVLGLHKAITWRKEQTRGMGLMSSFGLFLTTPAFVTSTLLFYFSNN